LLMYSKVTSPSSFEDVCTPESRYADRLHPAILKPAT
jgi:hypothetical protein